MANAASTIMRAASKISCVYKLGHRVAELVGAGVSMSYSMGILTDSSFCVKERVCNGHNTKQS